MAQIELVQLTKEFDAPSGSSGGLAVDHVDLTIEDGEFLVLVGPSGCGKTTTLRMVAGLEEPSSGEIRIGDDVVNDMTARRRDVAMVFQNYALYPHMTVFGNMAFALEIRKLPKDEVRRRVHEAAEILDLTDLLDRKPKAISGGQRQRVAMGRAIVREPRAFLMDEPLSNLDAKLRVQMRAEIARLQRRLGVTTLYVTHDQTEAMTMADRVAVMRRGTLQQVAPPQELYDHPGNLFVAGFIGSPSMNLVEGRIGSDCTTIEIGAQRLVPSAQWWAARPALAGLAMATVAVGIRPEHFEDASIEHRSGHVEISVTLVESMGAEKYVHGELDAPAVRNEEIREIAQDIDETTAVALVETSDTSAVVARCSPRTAVSVGDRLRLSVDPDQLHVFDLGTGAALG